MRVAVACDGLVVAPYFVQTTSYMIYNVERGIIVGSNNLPALDKAVEAVKAFATLGPDRAMNMYN